MDQKVTPEFSMIHAKRWARTLNSFGADRRPKGIQWSMYTLPLHLTPKRCRSTRCTGSKRKALLMSILANLVFFPDLSMLNMASSIVIYVRLHSCDGIPSFTLLPEGYDRSIMSRHLSCWWFLGINPNLFKWTPGQLDGGYRPDILPSESSFWR